MPTDNEAKRTGEAIETVAVVIPTLNEERSIGKVIGGVPVADLLKSGLETAVYVVSRIAEIQSKAWHFGLVKKCTLMAWTNRLLMS